MRSNPRVLVVSGLLLLAAALLAFLLGRAPDGGGDAAAGHSPKPGATAIQAAGGAESGASAAPATPTAADASRTEAAADDAAAPPLPGYLRLRIVRAEDDAPLPGAEVWFRDPDATLWVLHEGMQAQIEHDGDPFALFLRTGQHTTADARGEVELPQQWFGTQVAAVHGERTGLATLPGTEPDGGHVLRLQVQRALRVEVVQQDGSPAVGATVAAFLRTADDREERRVLGPTDQNGHLAMRNPASLRRELPKVTAWSIGIAAPGMDALRIAFDPADLPNEPIRLTLPPTGTVQFAVQDGRGSAIPGLFEIGIYRTDQGAKPTHLRSVATDGLGRATVPFVGLGEHLRAEVMAASRQGTDFDGPTRAGETVTVLLLPTADDTLIRGRIVTAGGAPLSDTPLDFRGEVVLPSGKAMAWSMPARTDPEGGFALLLNARAATASELRGRLAVAGTRRQVDGRFAELRLVLAEDLRHHDAGTLALQMPEVLMTGIVVLADGTPLDRARLAPEGESAFLASAPIQIAADGTFTLLATGGAVPPALNVTAPGCLPLRMPVVPGARDVRVVLEQACGLTVQVRLPAALLPHTANLRVELAGQGSIGPMGRSGDLLLASWSILPAGTYRVAIRLLGDPEPLAERQVTLGGAGAESQRREVFALGDALRVVRITLTDPAGAALTGSGVLLTEVSGEWSGRRAFDAFQVQDGTATVVTRGAVMAFEAFVSGCVPQRFQGPASDLTLRLQPLPEVVVRVAGLRDVAADTKVILWARDLDREGTVVRREHMTGPGETVLQTSHRVVLEGGAGILRLGRACRLGCRLQVQPANGPGGTVPLPEVSWSPGQERIELHVDPAALRAALQQGR